MAGDYYGMTCPRCGSKTYVHRTKTEPWGRTVTRYRRCVRFPKCGFMHKSYEKWDQTKVSLQQIVSELFRKGH